MSNKQNLAVISPEQVEALRTHVLPLFDFTRTTHYNATTWIGEYLNAQATVKAPFGLRLSTVGNSWSDFMIFMAYAKDIVHALVDEATPATRSANIKIAIRNINLYRQHAEIDPSKLMSKAGNMLKKIYNNLLTDKAKLAVAAFNSEYGVLLRKSWPAIIEIAIAESNALVEVHKLHSMVNAMDKSSVSTKHMQWSFRQVLAGWSFDQQDFHQNGWGGELVATSPDGLSRLELLPAIHKTHNGAFEFAIKPLYCMTENAGWFSWERTGVEGGESSFNTDIYTMEAAVEAMQAKINEARTKRTVLEAQGIEIDFGPRKIRMMPAAVTAMLAKLKAGKAYSIEPSGFGTAYVFSAHRGKWSKNASKALSEKVGFPIFFEEQDRD